MDQFFIDADVEPIPSNHPSRTGNQVSARLTTEVKYLSDGHFLYEASWDEAVKLPEDGTGWNVVPITRRVGVAFNRVSPPWYDAWPDLIWFMIILIILAALLGVLPIEVLPLMALPSLFACMCSLDTEYLYVTDDVKASFGLNITENWEDLSDGYDGPLSRERVFEIVKPGDDTVHRGNILMAAFWVDGSRCVDPKQEWRRLRVQRWLWWVYDDLEGLRRGWGAKDCLCGRNGVHLVPCQMRMSRSDKEDASFTINDTVWKAEHMHRIAPGPSNVTLIKVVE